jgi:hypothetical protein
VRVALHDGARIGDLHQLERLLCTLEGFPPCSAAHGEDLGDLLADANRRIQRRAGVLVDHRHRICAQAE